MNQRTIGNGIVDALFLVAWLFPVIVIAGYYFRVVGMCWREIERTFFGGDLSPDRFGEKLEHHPGSRYLPHDARKVTEKSIREAVREEFERIHSPRRYLFPLFLLIVISGCGLWLCHAWVCQRWFPPAAPNANEFPNTMSESVIMALAGAYAWGIYEIVERARDRTLTPNEIRELCFRWLVAIPIGNAFSLLATDAIKPMFAFAASAFPLKDIQRLVRENSLKKLGQGGDKEPTEQRLHLTLSGVSDVMASRLEELNVYTILDMAYASPIELMVKTGVPIRSVLDWMDQALFHVYTTSSQREVLQKKFGIRCSIDVCEFLNLHGRQRDPSFHELAAALSMTPPESLAEFLYRIADDPQVHCLYHLWYPHGAPKELGGERELESEAA